MDKTWLVKNKKRIVFTADEVRAGRQVSICKELKPEQKDASVFCPSRRAVVLT